MLLLPQEEIIEEYDEYTVFLQDVVIPRNSTHP